MAAAGLAALVGAAAHGASIQDDIQACGEAAVEAGLKPADGTTLRFVSDQGNQNRRLTLKAITDGAELVLPDCNMKRRKVLEVMPAEG